MDVDRCLQSDVVTHYVIRAGAMLIRWGLINNGSTAETERDSPSYACTWEVEQGKLYP